MEYMKQPITNNNDEFIIAVKLLKSIQIDTLLTIRTRYDSVVDGEPVIEIKPSIYVGTDSNTSSDARTVIFDCLRSVTETPGLNDLYANLPNATTTGESLTNLISAFPFETFYTSSITDFHQSVELLRLESFPKFIEELDAIIDNSYKQLSLINNYVSDHLNLKIKQAE